MAALIWNKKAINIACFVGMCPIRLMCNVVHVSIAKAIKNTAIIIANHGLYKYNWSRLVKHAQFAYFIVSSVLALFHNALCDHRWKQ